MIPSTEIVVGHPLRELVKTAYQADLPVLLEGTHGLGKSEILMQVADELGIDHLVMDLSLCEPTDLVGLPQFDKGRTVFAPPAELPTSGKGLLILEEINRAPRHVRAPCLQLLTARRLNSYKLPEGWLPVASINPSDHDDEDYRYDVEELDPALRSRFIVVSVKPGLREWLRWATEHKIHPAVIEVVERGGAEALRGAATPRSWAYAGRFLDAWEESAAGGESVLMTALVGLLGDNWGVALARQYLDGQQPLEPIQIVEGRAEVNTLVESWIQRGRLDMLNASWERLQRHLSSNVVARDIAGQPSARRNCERFVSALPADLRTNAERWLTRQLESFESPAATASVRVGTRGRARGRRRG